MKLRLNFGLTIFFKRLPESYNAARAVLIIESHATQLLWRNVYIVLYHSLLMNLARWFSVGFVFLMVVGVFVSAVDISRFEVNVFKEAVDMVRISVPDRVVFGNISKGQDSDEFKVDINNTGTVDVTVTPQLVDSGETIFSHLYFKRVLANPLTRIGLYSQNVSAPSTQGGSKAAYMYAVLDLRNFTGTISSDMMNHGADIKFMAVAQ